MMGHTVGKKQKRTRIIWLLTFVVFVVVASSALVYKYVYKKTNIYPLNPGPTINDESSKRGQVQNNQPGQKSNEPGSTQNVNGVLDTPTLTKSSGNNGPVPPGAIIEFVCESINGATCDIVLVNTDSSNSTINLGGKTITDDGRGQSAVLWNWTALKGTWKIAAKATKDGSTTSSQQQTLEVK